MPGRAKDIERFLRLRQGDVVPKARLFGVPPIGAGASTFREIARALSPSIDLCVLRFPGRESRLAEPPVSDWRALVAMSRASVEKNLNGLPFAVMGLCSGSIIAFEVCQELEAQGLPLPVALVVSGVEGPRGYVVPKGVGSVPREELKDVLHLIGVSSDVLSNDNMMAALEPRIRADLGVLEEYVYHERAPLSTPIVALAGSRDEFIRAEALETWRSHTSEELKVRVVDGGHLIYTDSAGGVCAHMAKVLNV